MALSTAEFLMHTTVRLECVLKNGGHSTGTGFFFSFKVDEEKNIPLIVTNKHVIQNSVRGTFVLTRMSDNGDPIIGSYESVVIDKFEEGWIKHPDDNIDLAVFPIAQLFRYAEDKGVKIFIRSFDENLIPNNDVLANLSGLEDITMIGYPNGIWDHKNNLPIIRHGITATSPKYDYCDLPIFVIDCACFPGSSGSPVLIFNQGMYAEANGTLKAGYRVIFLGILFAGPQHVAEGEIQTIDVPLQQIPISLSRIPNNLGFVVKASKIHDFRPLLEKMNMG